MRVLWLTHQRSLKRVQRCLACLIVVACAASPAAAAGGEPTPAYACVDPTDATARRHFQDEPCQLPLYHRPVAREPLVDPTTRWPSYRSKSDADGAHPMFWRFPVQPRGPYEVPRHSWR